MNEQENLIIVQQLYQAFENHDLQTILSLQTRDTEWSVASPTTLIPWSSSTRGRAGVVEFMKSLSAPLWVNQFEIKRTFAHANRVVVMGYQNGWDTASDTLHKIEFIHIWTFTGGKASKLRAYFANTMPAEESLAIA